PSVHALLSDQLEEERRLMYVAATRAKHRLFFTYPREGISADFTAANNTISPFLNEIPTGLVNSPSIRSYSSYPREKIDFQEDRPKTVKQTMGLTSFYPGMKVKHPFFGEGSIQAVKGPKTVEIYFPRHGKKTLRTDYTKLEILE
ncbi:MAG: ATP-dependent helicase, partial [Desulfobulbaceae bacterium]|nr:ATP-dependent helicase [Desulfobulbaceae bacterium]